MELRWGGESLGTVFLVLFTLRTEPFVVIILVFALLLILFELFLWFCCDNFAIKSYIWKQYNDSVNGMTKSSNEEGL